MCGIVGYIANTYRQNALSKFASQALLVDTLRGSHSTGVVFADQFTHCTYKRALAGYDFINLPTFTRMNKQSNDFFIGHNRAATMGTIDDETAHPFEAGEWVGVHNGTLKYGWEKDLGKGFLNDSEAIINSVHTDGLRETCEKLNGAFSLVLYNSQEHVLYFARNDERPMYILQCKDHIFFGSEPHLIRGVAERNGFVVEKTFATRVGDIVTITDRCEISIEGTFKPVKKTNPVVVSGGKGSGKSSTAGSSQPASAPATSTASASVAAPTATGSSYGSYLGYRAKQIANAYFTNIIKWGQKANEFKLIGFIDDDRMTTLTSYPYSKEDAEALLECSEALRIEVKQGVAYWEGKPTVIGKLVDPVPKNVQEVSSEKCAMCDGEIGIDHMMTQGSMPVCQSCCEHYGWV